MVGKFGLLKDEPTTFGIRGRRHGKREGERGRERGRERE